MGRWKLKMNKKTKIKIIYYTPGDESDINHFMEGLDVVDVKISQDNGNVIVMIIYNVGNDNEKN